MRVQVIMLAWLLACTPPVGGQRTAEGHVPFDRFVADLEPLAAYSDSAHVSDSEHLEVYFLQTEVAVNMSDAHATDVRTVRLPVSALGWRTVIAFGTVPELTTVHTFMATPDAGASMRDTAECCLFKAGPGQVLVANEIKAGLWLDATYLAEVPGTVYKRFFSWLEAYDRQHDWHTPVQVQTTTAWSDDEVLLPATNSHAFVWEALSQLAKMGVDLTPVIPTHRHRTVVSTATSPGLTTSSSSAMVTFTDAINSCVMGKTWDSGVALGEFVQRALAPCVQLYGRFVLEPSRSTFAKVTADVAVEQQDSTELPEPHYFSEDGGSWVDWVLTVIVIASFLVGVTLLAMNCGLKINRRPPFVECNRRLSSGHEHLGRERMYEMLNYRINAPQRLAATSQLPTSPRRFVRVRGFEAERNEMMLESTAKGGRAAIGEIEPDSADHGLLSDGASKWSSGRV